MNPRHFSLILAICCALSPAQAPAGHSVSTAELGFAYQIPADWDAVDVQSTLPEVKRRRLEKARSDEEKKEIACIRIPISARRGAPPSYLAVVGLPLGCFGQGMTEKDLPGFAQGSSEGLREIFDFGDPLFSTYLLGSHHMWIQRAKGNLKGHPEMAFTLEIACGMLKKAAVCWMAVAGDDQSLKDFERTAVTLDGDGI
jgi:hypothetical protein